MISDNIKKCLEEKKEIYVSSSTDIINRSFRIEKCLLFLESCVYNWKEEDNMEYLEQLLKKLVEPDNIGKLTNERRKLIYESCRRLELEIEEIFLTEKNKNLAKFNHNKYLAKIQNTMTKLGEQVLFNFGEEYEQSKYDFISYLLFEVKDLVWAKQLFIKLPGIANIADSNRHSLFGEMINHYLNEVMTYGKQDPLISTQNLVYYEELFDVVKESKYFKVSLKEKIDILSDIKARINSTNKDELNRLTKRKKLFWYNRVLEQIEEKHQEKTVPYLCYKHDVFTDFDESVLSEVRNYQKPFSTKYYDNRRVIDDYVITVDCNEAKELDDALSAKILENGNVLLGVHITDIASYIPEENIIIEESLERGTSIYLTESTIGMFADCFGKDLFSLNKGQKRLAISYFQEINNCGQVENFSIEKTVIKVQENFNYQTFGNILNKDLDQLGNEKDTYLALLEAKKRLDKSMSPNLVYRAVRDNDISITQNRIVGTSFAEGLIERAMVSTGHQMSKKALELGIPWIYRNHQISPLMTEELLVMRSLEISKFGNPLEQEPFKKMATIFQNTIPPATYNIDCTGHFGLNLDSYSHITSPIRRGSDLKNEYNLHEFYFNIKSDNQISIRRDNLEMYAKKLTLNRSNIEKFISSIEGIKILTKA